MQTLVESPENELSDGEFYLPWKNAEVLENELAPLLAINSGIVVFGGPVNIGKSRLLQTFASRKLEQGLSVLVIAHEHNDIQGVDTLIFHKHSWDEEIDPENAKAMLSRVEKIKPNVVIFDDMNYPEILYMANKLAENGTLVLAATFAVHRSDERIASIFAQFPVINGEDFSQKQESLIAGHLDLRNAYYRTGKINYDTRVVAQVVKA